MKTENKQQTINRYLGYIKQLESELSECNDYMRLKFQWKQQAINNYTNLLKKKYKVEVKII